MAASPPILGTYTPRENPPFDADDAALPAASYATDPRLSTLEAAVLDEYARLRENLDMVRRPPPLSRVHAYTPRRS